MEDGNSRQCQGFGFWVIFPLASRDCGLVIGAPAEPHGRCTAFLKIPICYGFRQPSEDLIISLCVMCIIV